MPPGNMVPRRSAFGENSNDCAGIIEQEEAPHTELLLDGDDQNCVLWFKTQCSSS